MKKSVELARGFSLIELMIVLAVIAVMLGVSAPAFTTMIKNNRMLTETYALRAALGTARSEAMARRSFVTVCRSGDGTGCNGTWGQGYIAFTDADGDGTIDAGDGDEIFVFKSIDLPPDFVVDFSSGANRVRFDSRGFSLNFSGTFAFCDDRGAGNAMGLIVTGVGTVSAAIDSDDPSDGTANDHMGANLACS